MQRTALTASSVRGCGQRGRLFRSSAQPQFERFHRIAVGTPEAGCPPHRPGRAGLPHPVPTLSFGVEALLPHAPGPEHLSRFPGSVSGTCRPWSSSSWLPSFPPPGPQSPRLSPPLPCSHASLVLPRHVTSRDRSSRGCGLSLSLAARLVRPRAITSSLGSRARSWSCPCPRSRTAPDPTGSRPIDPVSVAFRMDLRHRHLVALFSRLYHHGLHTPC